MTVGADAVTRRAYRARVLTPVAGGGLRYLPDGVIDVEGRRIATVAPFVPGVVKGPLLDLRPCVIIPGLVDTHVHYPQTRVIGRATGTLLAWLERTVFPEEARFHDEGYARAVAGEFTRAMLASGTTSCAAFSTSSPSATSVLFEALALSGMRAVAGLSLMDQRCPDALRVPCDRALAACAELVDRWHGHDDGRLRFAVTPRFALSCSRRLMREAARFAEHHQLLVQTHIAETTDEGDAVLAAHRHARTYLGVYDDAGLVGARTLLAHAIHLSAGEWDTLAARGAAVAHCPDSNFFLGSGRMRLAEARERGVRCGLGTDVAGGRTFDVRRIMASAYDTALCLGDRLPVSALLAMATLGGAEALGLDAVTGSLEPGKEADFVVLRLPRYAESEDDVVGNVVFGDTVRVERVFVRGKLVHMARRTSAEA